MGSRRISKRANRANNSPKVNPRRGWRPLLARRQGQCCLQSEQQSEHGQALGAPMASTVVVSPNSGRALCRRNDDRFTGRRGRRSPPRRSPAGGGCGKAECVCPNPKSAPVPLQSFNSADPANVARHELYKIECARREARRAVIAKVEWHPAWRTLSPRRLHRDEHEPPGRACRCFLQHA